MRSIAAHLAGGWQHAADPSWLEGWVERDFELPGGFTRMVVMGEGPPLLLLPPLPGFKEAYIACAFRLARRYRVVTYDLRWVFDPRCDGHVLGLMRHGVRHVPPGLALGRVRLAFQHDSRTELARLRCPALVVVGERESASYRRAAEELARLIPRARVALSPG